MLCNVFKCFNSFREAKLLKIEDKIMLSVTSVGCFVTLMGKKCDTYGIVV